MQQLSIEAPRTDARTNALLGFDTATLFESAAQPATMDSGIGAIEAPRRIAGPALTVACPPGDNLMLHAAVADAQPGEILVAQTHDGGYGVWGEALMTAAIVRGFAGLVILDPADIEATLARARQRREKEAAIMDKLRARQTTLDLLDLRRHLAAPAKPHGATRRAR